MKDACAEFHAPFFDRSREHKNLAQSASSSTTILEMTEFLLPTTATRRTLTAPHVTRLPCSAARSNSCLFTLVCRVVLLYRVCASLTRDTGDPTTPGYPAYENATRTDGSNIPKIPSLPISWNNAQKLLAEIAPPAESRKLTGLASKSTIKLVNHGMFHFYFICSRRRDVYMCYRDSG